MSKLTYMLEVAIENDEWEVQRLFDTVRECYGRSAGASRVQDDKSEVNYSGGIY